MVSRTSHILGLVAMNGDIDVIINAYRRHDLLERQVYALEKQSIAPQNIFIWNNGEPINSRISTARVINSPVNFGVWSRFFFAMNCESKFVAIFDDDTVPGLKFFENCLEHFECHPGIYGTRGLRFLSRNRYAPYHQYGWMEPNESLMEVDIVGHNWFLKTEWLPAFTRNLTLADKDNLAGEDIHLSFALQAELGIKTYVPPHPSGEQDLWGSIPELANRYGQDSSAISSSKSALSRFDKEVDKVCKNGFSLFYERSNEMNVNNIKIASLSRSTTLKRIIGKSPRMRRLARRIYYWLLSKNMQI